MSKNKAPVISLKEKRAKEKVSKDMRKVKRTTKAKLRDDDVSWAEIKSLSGQWAANFNTFQGAIPGWAALANRNEDTELVMAIRKFAVTLVAMNRTINALFGRIPAGTNLNAAIEDKQLPLYIEIMSEYHEVIFGDLTNMIGDFEALSERVSIYIVDATDENETTEEV